MAIEMVKVRARITLEGAQGTNLIAITPSMTDSENFILSFNVDKARGQISTFSASLKVKHQAVGGSIAGSEVKIEAGRDSPQNTIFRGIVRRVNITPCRDDPGYVILNVSGNDILSRLDGKKYTRRCRSSRGLWVGIEGITRKGLRSGKLAYTTKNVTLESWGGDVEKKDNVTRTRGLNKPENIPGAPKTAPREEVSLEVENSEPISAA